MPRPIVAILVAASLCCAQTARADKPPAPTTDPEPVRDDADVHRYSVALLGGLGAGAGAAVIIGGALIGNAVQLYLPLTQGRTSKAGQGSDACLPCSDAQLAPIRGYYYGGVAVLGVGAILLVTDVALAIVDHNYRKEHRTRRVSIAPGALRVRF
jgi:hypothetical protein